MYKDYPIIYNLGAFFPIMYVLVLFERGISFLCVKIKLSFLDFV